MDAGGFTQTLLMGHVAISLVGILTGFVTLFGLTGNRHLPIWGAAFLGSTLLTCLTGFPLPPFGLDPARVVGIITLMAVAAAGVGLYLFDLNFLWRSVYVLSSTIALYLNVFVAITQSFQKVALLHAVAPTQTEWPFIASHLVALSILVLLGLLAFYRFDPPPFGRDAGTAS